MKPTRAAAIALLLAIVAGCAAAPSPSPSPSSTPSPSPSPTPSPTPSPSPTPIAAGRPTRVAIASLKINLPVVNPPKGSTWPLCDVAEYFLPPAFQHPGAGGVTYIYAHAQEGMFLPILRWSIKDAKRLVGRWVDVWTANDWRYRYRVTEVRRRQKTLDWAFVLPPNSLVLQTSENQYRTGTKVMLVAEQVGEPVRVERAEARPKPKPRVCGR